MYIGEMTMETVDRRVGSGKRMVRTVYYVARTGRWVAGMGWGGILG
jgi:ATP-dependent 26S proteasome regulatory subunit